MKTLTLTIKKQYFDEIFSGKKKEEYRQVKPYWVKRLIDKDYDTITFINGYASNSPEFTIEYLGYEIKNIRHPFFGNESISVFALKLGKISD